MLATTIAAAGYLMGMLLIVGGVSVVVFLVWLIWAFRRSRPKDSDRK